MEEIMLNEVINYLLLFDDIKIRTGKHKIIAG